MGWTVAHGFFATMGGFMEYEENKPIRVLLPDELESYSLTGNGNFPRISKAEIEDKSKGDAISKGFAVLQTGWFVTQVIARGVQHLPITELELVTVAFATLNLVIYTLWWHKPLNVQRGVRVYKKRTNPDPTNDEDVEATVGFWSELRDALSGLPAAIGRGPVFDDDLDELPWLARVLMWPLAKPLYTMVGSEATHEKRVNTFYPAEWVEASEIFTFLLLGAVTLAFGGIHCIGWSFTFPSSIERNLWRLASLSITGVPIAFVPLAVVTPESCYTMLGVSLSLPYVLGRLTLLVLPFLCLRSLPPAVFHVVHWTSFIPHV